MSAAPRLLVCVANTNRPSLSAILRTWADFIDEAICVLSRGEPISLAGKRCLAHAADRMREAAEALR